ncbi:MAG TPA: hypothetical protein VIT43_15125 [Candidatus Dormibacteraeota bacterium]
MANAGWRLLVVSAAATLVALQLLLSQSDGGAASPAHAAATAGMSASADDAWSPPGCVEIVGAPAFSKCEPCPPLWLGGPTIRCVLKPSPSTRLVPAGVELGVLLGRRCPGLPRWAIGAGEALLVTRLCGYSAGE